MPAKPKKGQTTNVISGISQNGTATPHATVKKKKKTSRGK